MESNHKIGQRFRRCWTRFSVLSVTWKNELLILKRFKERFSENLNNRSSIYLVAVNEEDEPIGFISCHGQSLLHHEGQGF